MSTSFADLSATRAQAILQTMGSVGQPPERGALHVNVATDTLLQVLQREYLQRMHGSIVGTFKLVQAPFGGGKTQFLHAIRELAWDQSFATALVTLSPQECPFTDTVQIYKTIARTLEIPGLHADDDHPVRLDRVLTRIARDHIEEMGAQRFESWLEERFDRVPVESSVFHRACRHFLAAVASGDSFAREVLGDWLCGESVDASELKPYRIRESLDKKNAFLWLRSLTQVIKALEQPGMLIMFDEMDRMMSLNTRNKRELNDNLRHMIDACGTSHFPCVMMLYAVPPEFRQEIVVEYPALEQRLRNAKAFGKETPMQPIIDLDHLELSPKQLLEQLGERLFEVACVAYPDVAFDQAMQRSNVRALAARFAAEQLESGTRRTFVKACVSLLEEQRLGKQSALSADEIGQRVGSGGVGGGPELMEDEQEF